jgi:hypothetical protein
VDAVTTVTTNFVITQRLPPAMVWMMRAISLASLVIRNNLGRHR